MKQLQLTTAARRLAASLAIITALATTGAWAATTTYYQVKEKQDCTAIKIDGIASDIEIGYEPQLAFPGKTLDEINRCTLITELDGGEGDNTVTARATAWGLHPQRHKTNNSVDVLAYQFGASDENLAKAVVLVLTNGDGGVYVQKFGWCYHSTALYYNRRMYGLDGSNASFAKAQTAPDVRAEDVARRRRQSAVGAFRGSRRFDERACGCEVDSQNQTQLTRQQRT